MESSFKHRLATAMEAMGMSIVQLSKASGIHHVMIRRYLKGDEKGKKPTVGTLIALSQALKCPIIDLLGISDPTPEESASRMSNRDIQCPHCASFSVEVMDLDAQGPALNFLCFTCHRRFAQWAPLVAEVKPVKTTDGINNYLKTVMFSPAKLPTTFRSSVGFVRKFFKANDLVEGFADDDWVEVTINEGSVEVQKISFSHTITDEATGEDLTDEVEDATT